MGDSGGGGGGAPASSWARLSAEGSGGALAGCGLGLMAEIAISLGSDVRALLFWEQARLHLVWRSVT